MQMVCGVFVLVKYPGFIGISILYIFCKQSKALCYLIFLMIMIYGYFYALNDHKFLNISILLIIMGISVSMTLTCSHNSPLKCDGESS